MNQSNKLHENHNPEEIDFGQNNMLEGKFHLVFHILNVNKDHKLDNNSKSGEFHFVRNHHILEMEDYFETSKEKELKSDKPIS
jgi:hypothetical protein